MYIYIFLASSYDRPTSKINFGKRHPFQCECTVIMSIYHMLTRKLYMTFFPPRFPTGCFFGALSRTPTSNFSILKVLQGISWGHSQTCHTKTFLQTHLVLANVNNLHSSQSWQAYFRLTFGRGYSSFNCESISYHHICQSCIWPSAYGSGKCFSKFYSFYKAL